MVWIKRNLLFVVSAAVGLILMLGAGYYLYAGFNDSSTARGDLDTAQSDLIALQSKTPYPSKENIQAVKDSQQQVREVLNKFNVTFSPIAAPPKMGEQQFKDFLDKAILGLQTESTNYGVNLLPDYKFGFSGLSSKLNFPTNDIPAWGMELQEIKTICGILYRAKINSLESIRRPPVSSETNSVGGEADFLPLGSVVTPKVTRTPYEVVFRAYSSEIAGVLNGFLRSTNGFIIKNIDVAPSVTLANPNAEAVATPVANYGVRGGARPTARPMPVARAAIPAPVVQADPANPDAVPQGPETILSEGISRVVLLVEVINPKAP